MMIVNSTEILKKARKKGIAIPQFNINNLEWTKYILEECNKNNSPVILGITEKTVNYMGGYKVVSNLIKDLDSSLSIKIPIVIHLDHGSSFEACKEAIDNGFTSVMIDASRLSLEENIKLTKKVVEYAEKYTVTVEAELGSIGNNTKLYTNLEEAIEFTKKTKIDSLAPAIGTVHGIYQEQAKLDLNLCDQISKFTNIPLVLHGGSGLDEIIIKQAIKAGITKININTELQIAWSNALKKYLIENGRIYDPRKIISSGEKEIKRVIREKIDIMQSNK
ncbi:MAG: class II fructose-bisphosphate aldolase [Bacilli bacterium]|nr:class II fructose-bisphosphate aldolase [Bacilli bacterium]